MTDAIAIQGNDIIDLVVSYPEGIRLSQLMDVVDERFGKSVTFHSGVTRGNCEKGSAGKVCLGSKGGEFLAAF